MTRWLIKIYDFFERHRFWFYLLIVGVFGLSILSIARIRTNEDITSFLPLNSQQRRAMQYYADFADADRIVVIFEDTAARSDLLMNAVDSFESHYSQSSDSLPELCAHIDFADYMDVIGKVYSYMPFFLDSGDYVRMDSLLATPGYVNRQVQADQELLMLPLSSFAERRIQADPLNLFAPVVQSLSQFIPVSDSFTSRDGYMFSTDGRMAFAWLKSPYGQTESNRNAELVDRLNELCQTAQAGNPEVSIRILGAPVIAVENARCIKRDSLLASAIAIILICVILWFKLRDIKSLLLILLTLSFGWLCAVATLVTVYGTVSMIVVGVGSILIGIAANYPLHVVMHSRFASTVHQNIKELAEPLVIGNITTVGAFCSLLPLDSVAMRQLGLFAVSLLIGTILFSVIFLPHFVKPQGNKAIISSSSRLFSVYRGRREYTLFAIIAAVTLVFAFFLPETSFDSDMSHVNYMTSQQRADFARFAQLAGHNSRNHKVYIIHDTGSWNGNCAADERIQPLLDSMAVSASSGSTLVSDVISASRFLPSEGEIALRMQMWRDFTNRNHSQLTTELRSSCQRYGFADSAFAPFTEMAFSADAEPDSAVFIEIASTLFRNNVHGGVIADYCYVTPESEQTSLRILNSKALAFTAEDNNRQCVQTLSADFNFIGIVCSLVVFIFLWISFRRLSLAVIAFVPMAVSWVWILGIMNIAGLQFNIVNIILATFIFGQGDDYTIFMVNGLEYEHRTGQPIMRQFSNEILTSALIMLVGIGTLVLSRHPAMFSLGIVTLIGMCCVVIMALLIPPALYHLYLKIAHR